MSNCKNMITYSIGPIDRVPEGGKQWRLDLDKWLPELGITHLNPHNKPFKGPQEDDASRTEINAWKKLGKLKEIREKYNHIRTIDLRCVDYASFLIARIDVSVHMAGTYEEIVTANRQKKPILCHVVQGIEETPNWLVLMLPSWSFFNTMEEIKSYLEKINNTPYDELDKRWTIWK